MNAEPERPVPPARPCAAGLAGPWGSGREVPASAGSATRFLPEGTAAREPEKKQSCRRSPRAWPVPPPLWARALLFAPLGVPEEPAGRVGSGQGAPPAHVDPRGRGTRWGLARGWGARAGRERRACARLPEFI